jgi:UDPglucose 6-dehydrogenase
MMIVERLAILGVGRIGLCLALNLDRAGYDVLGMDQDRERVRLINEKAIRTPEPGVEEGLSNTRTFRATDDMADVRRFDPALVLVAVDSPSAAAGGYDAGHVDRVLRDLSASGPIPGLADISLVCTVGPGYCDSRSAAVKACGYALSYSPVFVAQGSVMRDQERPHLVLIGEADAAAGDRIGRVFRTMCLNEPPVHRMPRLSAEIAKLATNCFLTMKIAFANAIGDLATRVNADPERILAAVGADPRIGRAFLSYGFGYGGPCLPRDNRALNCFAKQHDSELLQADATDEMNQRHLAFQVAEHLRTHREDEPIVFYSVSYKPRTEILDESQPLALAVKLARAGRRIVICEAPGMLTELRERFGDLFEYQADAGVWT